MVICHPTMGGRIKYQCGMMMISRAEKGGQRFKTDIWNLCANKFMSTGPLLFENVIFRIFLGVYVFEKEKWAIGFDNHPYIYIYIYTGIHGAV